MFLLVHSGDNVCASVHSGDTNDFIYIFSFFSLCNKVILEHAWSKACDNEIVFGLTSLPPNGLLAFIFVAASTPRFMSCALPQSNHPGAQLTTPSILEPEGPACELLSVLCGVAGIP